MGCRYFRRLRLHLTAAEFHRRAAVPADQMMVLALSAAPADRFACVGADQPDEIGRRQGLQRSVDGRQANVL